MNWRYIMNRVLAAILITLILGFIHKAHAGIINLSNADYSSGRPSTFTYDNNVWQYNPKTGTAAIVGNDVTVMDNFKIPTSQGRVPVTITQRAPINAARVGLALGNFLKRGLPLVGTAVAVYDLACEVQLICHQPDGSVKIQTPAQEQWKPQYNLPATFPTPEAACQSVDGGSALAYDHTTVTAPNLASCYFHFVGNPSNIISIIAVQLMSTTSGGTRDLTPQDYVDFANTMTQEANQRRAAETLLLQKDEPFPVDAPTVTSTTETPIKSETQTVRDQTGTATGTSTSITTAKVEPPPTGSPPSTATYTENTVTTVTNITNNTSNSTTTVTSPPDDPVSKDPEVFIDNVSDLDLPHHDIENTFQPQSFGEGSCPADPQVSYSHGSITLPFHIACDFASMIRAIVLILCSLSAAYIIAETKYD